jgi:hypothetical protein
LLSIALFGGGRGKALVYEAKIPDRDGDVVMATYAILFHKPQKRPNFDPQLVILSISGAITTRGILPILYLMMMSSGAKGETRH